MQDDTPRGGANAHDERADDAHSILRRTPFMLTRCSADLRYLYVTPAYARMIGHSPSEVVGKSIIEVMGEAGFKTILPHIKRVLDGHEVEYEEQVHFKDVGNRWLHATYTPDKDATGKVRAWVASIIDTTEKKRAEDRVAADLSAMMLLRAVGAACNADGAEAGTLQKIIQAAITLVGAQKGNLQLYRPADEALQVVAQQGFDEHFLRFFETIREDAASSCGAAMRSGRQIVVQDVLDSDIFAGTPSGKVIIEAGVRAVISTPVVSSKNHLLGMLSTYFDHPHQPHERELHLVQLLARLAGDYLERKEAEQRQQTLLGELTHRTHNLLAVVHSIASGTLSRARTLSEATTALEGRLQALARANRELIASNWEGADLLQIVGKEFEPFADRISVAGAKIVLDPVNAQTFSMIVHELTTNAVKYGALSNTSGSVKVSWSTKQNGESRSLYCSWLERGGPEVASPTRKGFGTWLLKSAVQDINIDYGEDGLSCEFNLPLRPLKVSPADQLKTR